MTTARRVSSALTMGPMTPIATWVMGSLTLMRGTGASRFPLDSLSLNHAREISLLENAGECLTLFRET